MSRHSEEPPLSLPNGEESEESLARQRRKLMGLGERSFHKSYYPELRKRLEELERFRTLLDQANDGIFLVLLPTAVLVDCNESGARALAKSREDILERPVSEVFANMGRDVVLGALDAPRNGDTVHRVVCLEHGQGACQAAMELTISVRAMGEEHYAVIVAHDVTERIRNEQALRQAEEKYRSIFENALEGIYQVGLDGRLLSCNPVMARIMGYGSEAELRAAVRDVREQLYADPLEREQFLKDIMSAGEVVGRELRFRCRNGDFIWASITARLVRDAAGDPLFIEGFAADITERKQAQEALASLNKHLERLVNERTQDLERKAQELEQANARLQELDELKTNFVSSVSHELRTPLTSILGFAKLIARDYLRLLENEDLEALARNRYAQRILDNLVIITQESERLSRLVNDFLDLAKIEAGRLDWQDELLDFRQLAQETLTAMQAQIEARPDVVVHQDIAPDIPPLHADRDRLTQVLVNLLTNALKFTPSGEILLSACHREGVLQIRLRDTGHGIPRDELSKIFDKFHQAADRTARGEKTQGTGLGLAIVQSILEHYQGEIWAESEPGHGAEFVVELPLHAARHRMGSGQSTSEKLRSLQL